MCDSKRSVDASYVSKEPCRCVCVCVCVLERVLECVSAYIWRVLVWGSKG